MIRMKVTTKNSIQTNTEWSHRLTTVTQFRIILRAKQRKTNVNVLNDQSGTLPGNSMIERNGSTHENNKQPRNVWYVYGIEYL